MFKWLLDRVEDTNGNFMTIDYYKDDTNGQIYLEKIGYTGNSGMVPSNYVEFHLEDRTDELLSYTSHSKAKTIKRLKTIEIRSYGNELVRAYELNYKTDYEPSVLESVTQYGDDASIQGGNIVSGSSLPPIDMAYQVTEDGYDLTVSSFEVEPFLKNVHAQGDFNGDNRTDFIYGLSDEYGRMGEFYCFWPLCYPARWLRSDVYIS